MKNPLHIRLPLPPSINRAYIGTGRRGDVGKKRSYDYENWIENAGTFFRLQFPEGIKHEDILKGRVLCRYILLSRDFVPRDVSNYIKVAEDYLRGKFYEDDNQIDEIYIRRRIDESLNRNFLLVWAQEIPDKRKIDMLNPA